MTKYLALTILAVALLFGGSGLLEESGEVKDLTPAEVKELKATDRALKAAHEALQAQQEAFNKAQAARAKVLTDIKAKYDASDYEGECGSGQSTGWGDLRVYSPETRNYRRAELWMGKHLLVKTGHEQCSSANTLLLGNAYTTENNGTITAR